MLANTPYVPTAEVALLPREARLYEALATIRAPHGQWACLGNHDYDDPARIARRLDDAGVVLLRDRLRTIEVAGQPLEIAGTNFVFARTPPR